MVASFEVMALCLEGITSWVVCLYVQIGMTVAVAYPIMSLEDKMDILGVIARYVYTYLTFVQEGAKLIMADMHEDGGQQKG